MKTKTLFLLLAIVFVGWALPTHLLYSASAEERTTPMSLSKSQEEPAKGHAKKGFSFEELEKKAKEKAQTLYTEKAEWDKKTKEMQAAFNKVTEYENEDIKPELKAGAWIYFLEMFPLEDNPYSDEIDAMKQKAKEKVKYYLAMANGIDPRLKDPLTGMEFVFVKGGCFQMGDMFGNGESNEKPAHEVCVDDLYIGKYEVTQAEWQKIMGNNPSHFQDCDNCPVEDVSWNDAQKFIHKLNQMIGKKYRLPTEAEWEYAARSGGKKEKWAGTSSKSELNEYAWYDINSGKKTHPVGQKKSNGLGLYDMSGNVREWVQDWYDGNYYKNSPKNNPNPKEPDSAQYRVIRGGSWFSAEDNKDSYKTQNDTSQVTDNDDLRTTNRFRKNPARNNGKDGFRMALSAQ